MRLSEINPTEKRMIELLAAGYTQKEIADKVNAKISAVNCTLKRAGQKVGARTTIHLVVIAKEQKLIA